MTLFVTSFIASVNGFPVSWLVSIAGFKSSSTKRDFFHFYMEMKANMRPRRYQQEIVSELQGNRFRQGILC